MKNDENYCKSVENMLFYIRNISEKGGIKMPDGIEIERKYIIHMPIIEEISSFPEYTTSHITQTYLNSGDGSTLRVRKREYGDKISYTETRKIPIDKISVEEIEREISDAEYLDLIKNARDDSSPVIKTRHTFEYLGHTVEVDVYPQWSDFCIMETELESRDEVVEYPSAIKILREVTGDKRYSNAGMAREFPEEPEMG